MAICLRHHHTGNDNQRKQSNVVIRSNREHDYFGNVLVYDYFALYSSTITQKVLILEYEYEYRVRLLHLCSLYLRILSAACSWEPSWCVWLRTGSSGFGTGATCEPASCLS